MLRVVLDTNVIVSGAISSSGAPFEILKSWQNRKFVFVTSPPILREVERVLAYPKIKRSYSLDPGSTKAILMALRKYSMMTPGKLKVSEIKRDPSDNMFLACAKESKADVIVSGDAHLLDIKSFDGMPIMTAREFIETIKKRLG